MPPLPAQFSPPPSHVPFPIRIRLYKRGRTTVGPRGSGAPGCRVLRVKEGQIATGASGVTGFPSRRLNNNRSDKRQQIFRHIIIDPIFFPLEV